MWHMLESIDPPVKIEHVTESYLIYREKLTASNCSNYFLSELTCFTRSKVWSAQ